MLYRAVKLLTADPITPNRLSVSLDALLNDLELFDDPRQGLKSWLFADEYPVADELRTRLHQMVELVPPGEAGTLVLGHPEWSAARAKGLELLDLIQTNGRGRPISQASVQTPA